MPICLYAYMPSVMVDGCWVDDVETTADLLTIYKTYNEAISSPSNQLVIVDETPIDLPAGLSKK